MMACFQLFKKDELELYLHRRPGETHLGEMVFCAESEYRLEKHLQNKAIQFVLVGLPEDVGIRANRGIGGARTTWPGFLKSFLNIQETQKLSGETLLLYGALETVEDSQNSKKTALSAWRQQTAEIDKVVFPVVKKIVEAGKIPVVIGGGHNNAYPIIKGVAEAMKKTINTLNTDAHADFRALEGRHSGNGFSYAVHDGYLKKYFALGLHEAYNSYEMIELMAAMKTVKWLYFEDVFLRRKTTWDKAVQAAIDFVSDELFGVELDVDSIQNTLSSAMTPVGISPREAMSVLYACGRNPNSVYLHLPEGVAKRDDGLENPVTGKLLSYLVQSFAKGVLER